MKKRPEKIRFAIILIALAFLIYLLMVTLFTQPLVTLTLYNRGNGEEWEIVLPSGTFSLGFTHSVMKTPVEEFYRVDRKDGLVLEKTVYQSYGVGLPFLPEEGELTVEDGVFTLVMERTIGILHMTISSIPGHWLEVEGTRYSLDEWAVGGGSITLSATTQRRWKDWRQ